MPETIISKLGAEVAKLGKSGCGTRFKYVRGGDWRTVETFWNVPKATCFFREPAGTEIKVRYGVGFLGKDSQKQKLDGFTVKKLEIGGASFFLARIQVRVKGNTNIEYVYCPF